MGRRKTQDLSRLYDFYRTLSERNIWTVKKSGHENLRDSLEYLLDEFWPLPLVDDEKGMLQGGIVPYDYMFPHGHYIPEEENGIINLGTGRVMKTRVMVFNNGWFFAPYSRSKPVTPQFVDRYGGYVLRRCDRSIYGVVSPEEVMRLHDVV